jgi:hypothetical protein
MSQTLRQSSLFTAGLPLGAQLICMIRLKRCMGRIEAFGRTEEADPDDLYEDISGSLP